VKKVATRPSWPARGRNAGLRARKVTSWQIRTDP
jgi:hypothetical protein